MLNRLRELPIARSATLKTQKVAEVVELEQKLANERIFRDRLQNNLTGLLRSINDELSSDELKELINNMDGSTLAVGNAEFEAVQKLTKESSPMKSIHCPCISRRRSKRWRAK